MTDRSALRDAPNEKTRLSGSVGRRLGSPQRRPRGSAGSSQAWGLGGLRPPVALACNGQLAVARPVPQAGHGVARVAGVGLGLCGQVLVNCTLAVTSF